MNQTYVTETGSTSASLVVAVAIRVWFVVGLAGVSATVAVGAAFVRVIVAVAVLLSTVPRLPGR